MSKIVVRVIHATDDQHICEPSYSIEKDGDIVVDSLSTQDCKDIILNLQTAILFAGDDKSK